MKRILSFILSLMLLFSLAACADTPDPGVPGDPEGTQTPPETESTAPDKADPAPDAPPAEPAPARLTLLKGREQLQEWSEGVSLCAAGWETLKLDAETAAAYPALAAPLDAYNAQAAEDGRSFMEDNREWAGELYDVNPEYFYGINQHESYAVQRADGQILSIRGDWNSYTGGAHPNYGVFAINLDPESGRTLTLGDVLTSTDGLHGLLEEALRAKYPDEPFPSLPEMLAEYTDADFTWTMGYQGLTVYFSPYEIAAYASGLLEVTFWFDEHPELFRPDYLELPAGGYAFALPLASLVELDLDPADGKRDLLEVYTMPVDEYGTLELVISINGRALHDAELYAYEMSPWLVQTTDACYLYMDTTSDNDYNTLAVYQLDPGGARLVDYLHGCGFHSVWFDDEGEYGTVREVVFTDPTAFVLDSRIEILGTMTGTRLYAVDGASGLPVTADEAYAISADHLPLTTLRPITVTVEGKAAELPAGTELHFLRTDGETYVDMALADGSECRIMAARSDEGWGWQVNGISEWDCFDGLLYAG